MNIASTDKSNKLILNIAVCGGVSRQEFAGRGQPRFWGAETGNVYVIIQFFLISLSTSPQPHDLTFVVVRFTTLSWPPMPSRAPPLSKNWAWAPTPCFWSWRVCRLTSLAPILMSRGTTSVPFRFGLRVVVVGTCLWFKWMGSYLPERYERVTPSSSK